MNRRILLLVALCCALLTSISCSQEAGIGTEVAGSGVLSLKISATRTELTPEYDPMDHLNVRIYNSEGGLLREYSTKEALPSNIELLAGNYRITVEAGQTEKTIEQGCASFSMRLYKGEANFSVVAEQTISLVVVCKCINTVVEVRFDSSITKNFSEAATWVAAAESFNEEDALAGVVPALKYTQTAKGYFDLLEGQTTFVWNFSGEHTSRGTIEKSGVIANIKQGGKYVLTMLFSPDLPGFIEGFPILVDTSTEIEDDTIIFSPDPVIEGIGFDIAQTQEFLSGQKQISIVTVKPLQNASMILDGTNYDLITAIDGSIPGIQVEKIDLNTLIVTLSDPLFAKRAGGNHTLTFSTNDTAGGAMTTPATFRLQGIVTPTAADYNLWDNSVTLRIVQLAPEVSNVKFELSTPAGISQEVDGVKGADGLYSATISAEWMETKNEAGHTIYTLTPETGVFANMNYLCRATIDGVVSTTQFSTSGTQPIPDGDMESGLLPCFSSNSASSAFWASGNAATAGLCQQSAKAGMGGSHCALLKPGVTFGNLAAGNLFSATFEFASLKGSVYFGVPYTWQARPRALQFKHHATVGRVNYGTASDYEYIKDGQDRIRLFVAIVDWSSRHVVTVGLSAPSGIWDPAKATSTGEGAIIGYGSLLIKDSTPGEEMVTEEMELYFYDKTTKPSAQYSLVISAATSAYGDYKVGCSNNALYLDDFEWVY